ncbi:hypothetical protein DKT68_30130 [Micromonospora acroterricola]|uniref:Uncharacterized protein n=1 Tax=Micromonospora acroterricola TaxID=2202421 RepID=A0A317CQR5_9ACTN|nr:hypothetical protein [Micromonospora acroterricola]PWR04829.1 hypothetical protein DKT68_30130 [Micromonospora acroterricola]
MVTRRVAEMVLAVAARRWPTDLRDDLQREWVAELHVLAADGRRTKMVGFAVSLAVGRAGAPLVDRTTVHRRARRCTVAALLLAPPACVGIVVGTALAMNPIQTWLMGVRWSERAQKPLALRARVRHPGGPVGARRAGRPHANPDADPVNGLTRARSAGHVVPRRARRQITGRLVVTQRVGEDQ